jgi:hypothetical protein
MSISVITINGQNITLVSAPTTAVLRTAEWNLYDAVAVVESQFSPRAQRQWWPGADKWGGTMTYPPLNIAQANDVTSFLMQLRGRANAFQLGDPLHTAPRGSGLGNPFVNNTPGTNLPGAITLATSGWTPNAAGVLLRGDQIQVGFRLYQVLDTVDADPAGNAVLNIWPSLRETPASTGSGLPFLNATAAVTMTASRPLGAWFNGVQWSNFSTPALPPDAVISGIYATIVLSAHHNQAASYFRYGPTLDLNFAGGTVFNAPSNPEGTTFASGAYSNNGGMVPIGIGTSLSDLVGQKIEVQLNSSLFLDGMTDTINVTAVGFAIYYTSATPTTDPQMPTVFSVPSGYGVAWSLPFTVATTGTTNTGTAVGTPALDNGGIILYNPKGLWALSSNKRAYSEDGSKGKNATTAVSFPLEEYIAG